MVKFGLPTHYLRHQNGRKANLIQQACTIETLGALFVPLKIRQKPDDEHTRQQPFQ